MLKSNQNFIIQIFFCSFTSALLILKKNQLPYELHCVILKMGSLDFIDKIKWVQIPLSPQNNFQKLSKPQKSYDFRGFLF